MPDKGKRGRPSKYTDEIAAMICERIAQGETLVAICRGDDAPSYSTVLKWRAERQEFSEMYARAREDSADWDADEIKAIADDPELDPNDKRVRIDARKWLAGKKNAKHYGDRVQQEITGANGGPVVMWGAKPADG